MKKKLLAVMTALIMAITGSTGFMLQSADVVSAGTEDPFAVEQLDGEIPTQQQNYMTDSQYKKLFGVDLNAKEIEAFDPDNTDNPLEGYQPMVLSELFLGYMNRTNNYDGYFAVMENASTASGFNVDTMWNTNYGEVNKYYGEDSNEDMYTHAINTIALTPGDLTEEGARTRQQILIENRIYLKEDGALYEDDVYHMLNTYTLKSDGSSWTRTQCKNLYLSDAHWAWYIDVPEEQTYTGMAVGDYDGDNYNEVAVYVPAHSKAGSSDDKWPKIEIYQPQTSGEGYTLNKEYTISLKDIGPRFGIEYDEFFAYAHLNTTKIAGRDDLVIAASLPYKGEKGYTNNGALAVVSFRNGTGNIEFNTDLKYDSNAYRFKMQASTNADLDGDGTDELVIGGFKNTGYNIDGDDRGDISDSEYLVNVLLYENGAYKMAWSKPQVTAGVDLDHSREMDAPVAMAAGKYRMGSARDTVFLEGTYLDFSVGEGDTAADRIRNGRFTQDTSENMTGLSNATINIGASGAFVSEMPGNEQVVFYTTHGSGDVDVDIRWGHPGENGRIATDITNDNYIDDTEEDDGTIISMCPVNVDQDASAIKYTGKTVGWSNPIVYGVLMSMPYWQEMDYGDVWNDRGQTDFGITKSHEDGTTVTAGVDVGATVNICGEATVFGNGVGAGLDIGAVGSYAYENTKAKELSKNITWSAGAGEDSAALMVMPIVTYEYEVYMPEHAATKEEQAAGKSGTVPAVREPIVCISTFEPVATLLPVDTYNDVIEEFNLMAEAAGNSQDKLPVINMEEIYAGSKVGDPSSYVKNPKDISSLEGSEGEGYYYIGEAHAQTGKDKQVETLNIETTSSSSESNGFTAGLKGSLMGKVMGGLDFMSIVSVTGSIGLTLDAQAVGGKTWLSTESTGITYSGSFVSPPSEAAGYGYEYSAGLVKWNADLEGFDQGLEVEGTDEVLPDKTIVIGPTVTMLSEAPPALPDDLHVLGVTKGAAVLEWTNPVGNRAPDSYTIYYSMEEDGVYRPLDLKVDGSQTRQVVEGLSAGTSYYFRLESHKGNARSVQSVPVEATTKTGEEPVITKHPQDVFAEIGDTAEFVIAAEPGTEGNTISYQWQQLQIDDYGISWININDASDSNIGKEAVFNAAYFTPEGTVREQDIDDLNGNVYRCIVAEKQDGKLDYIETVSNTATLYAGEENILTETVLEIELVKGAVKYKNEAIVGVGDEIVLNAGLADAEGTALKDADVYFAIIDKNTGECAAHKSAKTDDSGAATITFTVPEWAGEQGSYEIIAVSTGKAEGYRDAVSNVINVDVNEAYEIVYELNGGINHNMNPVKYAIGSRYILLHDAARNGHEFTGWYLDAGLTERVDGKWLDISEMEGPLKLYAGWKAIPGDSGKPDDSDSDKPGDSDKPDSGDSGSQTGDDFNMAVPLVLMLCAVSVLGALLARRRK